MLVELGVSDAAFREAQRLCPLLNIAGKLRVVY